MEVAAKPTTVETETSGEAQGNAEPETQPSTDTTGKAASGELPEIDFGGQLHIEGLGTFNDLKSLVKGYEESRRHGLDLHERVEQLAEENRQFREQYLEREAASGRQGNAEPAVAADVFQIDYGRFENVGLDRDTVDAFREIIREESRQVVDSHPVILDYTSEGELATDARYQSTKAELAAFLRQNPDVQRDAAAIASQGTPQAMKLAKQYAVNAFVASKPQETSQPARAGGRPVDERARTDATMPSSSRTGRSTGDGTGTPAGGLDFDRLSALQQEAFATGNYKEFLKERMPDDWIFDKVKGGAAMGPLTPSRGGR